jgi:molybdopterin synthase catalytic subunit
MLAVGETSVAIVAAAPQRAQAFAAAEFAIDQIKQTVPIWKKQETLAGAVWKQS